MTNVVDDFDTVAGLEKANYQRFQRTYAIIRPGQAPGKFDDWNTMELPNGSVLHTMRDVRAEDSWLPDVNLPLVANERFPIYLKMQLAVAGETDQPLGVKEQFIYQPGRMVGEISHFFQSHKRFHRIMSDRTLSSMNGVLTWIDYGALNNMVVRGAFHDYRKFEIIFRTVLDQVYQIGGEKHHYIVIPQGAVLHTRALLQKTFSDLSNKTLIAIQSDSSVYFLIHLLGFAFGKHNKLSVTPSKNDVALFGKDSQELAELRSTSLLDRLPKTMFPFINFVLQSGDRAVVYNLADLDTMTDDKSFYIKLYRHMMNLRVSGSGFAEHADPDSENFDAYVESVIDEQKEKIANSVIEEGPTPSSFIEVTHDPLPVEVGREIKSFRERLASDIDVHHQSLLDAEPKKKDRLASLTEAHLSVVFAGRSLGDWIKDPAPEEFAPKDMSFLKDVPEESYKQSTLIAMDRAYQDHVYHHELAKVVASLAKHGFFIVKTEEEIKHTEMDQTVTHKLHLQDLSGRSHHLRFTLPVVSRDGLMKLSGVDYRLTRQMANVPISKVSSFRVSLSSYYNKILVERIQSKRWSYEVEMMKLITRLRDEGALEATLGTAPLPSYPVAYDYTAIGRNFTDITVGEYQFSFTAADTAMEAERSSSGTTGIWIGKGPGDSKLYWNLQNTITCRKGKDVIDSWSSFRSFLASQLGADRLGRMPVEWVQASIINQTIPLVYILAYHHGLKTVLNMLRLNYRFYPNKRDVELGMDDIAVPMADGVLVFNRYPLHQSLIASGLLWADLRDISFSNLSIPDSYASVFNQKGLSVGVLKGLRGFFSFFVDPITEKVLEKMGEPTSFSGLLIRATEMLCDYHAIEPSSVELHRYRLYERFNGIVYNEILRALANHRNNPSTRKSFSINPQAVFTKIVTDATVSTNDVINPVHEVKQRANFTFTGMNGRAGQSFMPKDRIYPKDGLGVISDAVPDSGKVGITAYLSSSPRIDDVHGIPQPYKQGDKLEPPQILSVGSMVMPGGTTDDGKRNSYLSIQISHYVPNRQHGETLSVRTGYDRVLPHLCTDVFSYAADQDGVVESVDDKTSTLVVRYADKPVVTAGKVKLPYLDTVINQPLEKGQGFGLLIAETDLNRYPIGGIFQLTTKVYGEVTDRLRIESVAAIPDQSLVRKQADLIREFERGRVETLYYLRFIPREPMIKGAVKAFSFKPIYSQNSGSYLLQNRVVNFKAGDAFKNGDILVYNPGFFVPDPMSKQVTFKHGVTATVVLMEKSTNHEDACEIFEGMSDKLAMTPCHLRPVVTTNTSAILAHVKVGDYVETSDSLCVISDGYLVDGGGALSLDNIDIIEKLNRQTPTAQNTGTIRKVRILYGCDRDQLSDSLKAILKTYEKEVRDDYKALAADKDHVPPERPGWVEPGTKYQGIDFTNTTVVLEFMIEKSIKVYEGDKIVIGNANKSVVAYVNKKPHMTQSGMPIDIVFSTTSVTNRIVSSPLTVGMAERNMEELRRQVVDNYFNS